MSISEAQQAPYESIDPKAVLVRRQLRGGPAQEELGCRMMHAERNLVVSRIAIVSKSDHNTNTLSAKGFMLCCMSSRLAALLPNASNAYYGTSRCEHRESVNTVQESPSITNQKTSIDILSFALVSEPIKSPRGSHSLTPMLLKYGLRVIYVR